MRLNNTYEKFSCRTSSSSCLLSDLCLNILYAIKINLLIILSLSDTTICGVGEFIDIAQHLELEKKEVCRRKRAK